MASVAKVIEVLADSEEGFEEATRVALARAKETVENVRNVYIKDMQAIVRDGEIISYRVNAKITFVLNGGE